MAILYSDAKREYFPTEQQYFTEAEVIDRAKLIAPYFEKIGFKRMLIPGDDQLATALQKFKPDFVLNLVDSVRGQEHLAATIPALLEILNIPYVGTGMLGLAINSNKFLTKKLLDQAGVPSPHYQLFNSPNDPINLDLKFPLISKLNEIHGSVEIGPEAVSENEQHLRERLKKLMSVYNQPVLAEEFIVGRELTAFVLEGATRKIYIGEKAFPPSENKFKLAGFEAVWKDVNSYDYAKVERHGILEGYVRSAFDILKMDDYGKFDVRLDESGRYYFIDCNANPSFGPYESTCAISLILKMHGVDFEEIIRRLIINLSRDSNNTFTI